MSNPEQPPPPADDAREKVSAMFASLVMQQTNMASIFLGLVPHPQSGKVERDIGHARFFIDQLEMIEVKTRGNLDKTEEGLLKHSLTSLRLAFVEAVSKPAETSSDAGPKAGGEGAATAPTTTGASEPPAAANPGAPPTADDSKIKFSKKY